MDQFSSLKSDAFSILKRESKEVVALKFSGDNLLCSSKNCSLFRGRSIILGSFFSLGSILHSTLIIPKKQAPHQNLRVRYGAQPRQKNNPPKDELLKIYFLILPALSFFRFGLKHKPFYFQTLFGFVRPVRFYMFAQSRASFWHMGI